MLYYVIVFSFVRETKKNFSLISKRDDNSKILVKKKLLSEITRTNEYRINYVYNIILSSKYTSDV